MALKPYRVKLPSGLTTVLQLSEETQQRDYPDAVEVKIGAPEIKDAPKPRRRKADTEDSK